jgi:plasmid stabilization system protein ParE
MNKFVLSAKAKSDLIKIAKYTQLTWGQSQRNDYLKILDSTFHLLADEPEIGIQCLSAQLIKAGRRYLVWHRTRAAVQGTPPRIKTLFNVLHSICARALLFENLAKIRARAGAIKPASKFA